MGLTFTIIILTVIFGALPVHDAYEANKMGKFWFLLGLAALLLFVQTCKSCEDVKDAEKAKDSAQALHNDLRDARHTINSLQKDLQAANEACKTTTTLSTLTLGLTKQIDTLSRLNNAIGITNQNIGINNQKLTNDAKTLVSENLSATRNLNNLTENAKYLLDKLYDDVSDGNSVPIVYARTFKDEIQQYNDGGYVDTNYRNTDWYWKYIELENKGDYKISDLRIVSSKGRYRSLPDVFVLFNRSLLSKENVRIFEQKMTPLIHASTEPSEEEPNLTYSYAEDDGYGNTLNTIYVSWRNLKYEYYYEVKSDLEITVSGYYVYNNKAYPTKENLYNAIMKERESEKQKRLKLSN